METVPLPRAMGLITGGSPEPQTLGVGAASRPLTSATAQGGQGWVPAVRARAGSGGGGEGRAVGPGLEQGRRAVHSPRGSVLVDHVTSWFWASWEGWSQGWEALMSG